MVYDPTNDVVIGKGTKKDHYDRVHGNSTHEKNASGELQTAGIEDLAVTEAKLAASAVAQGKLKTDSGEVSTITGEQLTLPGGEYGFYPQIRMSATDSRAWDAFIVDSTQAGWTGYLTTIWIDNDGSGDTIYAQQRYIQASPPYMIGDTNWGHFLFLLRKISDGMVVSAYQAKDPPWAYNGPPQNTKNSIARIQAVPHPFVSYFDKDPAIDGLEIVLVDLRGYDTNKWKSDNEKLGKSILEDLSGNIDPGSVIVPATVGLPDIAGFTDKVKIMSRI